MSTLIKTVVITPILLFSLVTHAQESISTERPSQSNSGSVLLPGRLNVETGFQFQKTTETVNDLQLNTTLLRYGVNEFFELRGSFNYLRTDVELDGSDGSQNGWSPSSFGVKMKLLEESGWIPQAALTVMMAMPWGSGDFSNENVVPSIRFSAHWGLGENGQLGYNQALEWSDQTSQVTNAFTLIYAHSITNSLTWFIESYGFITDGEGDHRADTGIALLLNDKLQVDAFGGIGFSDISPDWFAACGVSFALFE